MGIKTHYDQWNDISDEAAKRDLETEQKNLAELKRQFPKEKLDAQTKLSCELYEFKRRATPKLINFVSTVIRSTRCSVFTPRHPHF